MLLSISTSSKFSMTLACLYDLLIERRLSSTVSSLKYDMPALHFNHSSCMSHMSAAWRHLLQGRPVRDYGLRVQCQTNHACSADMTGCRMVKERRVHSLSPSWSGSTNPARTNSQKLIAGMGTLQPKVHPALPPQIGVSRVLLMRHTLRVCPSQEFPVM